MRRNPLQITPCWFLFVNSPCKFLLPFESLLLTWNPSSCVVRSRPPWSQVAHKLTSPFHSLAIPSHSNFPNPRGFPKSTAHPTKTTSQSWLHIGQTESAYTHPPACLFSVFLHRGAGDITAVRHTGTHITQGPTPSSPGMHPQPRHTYSQP
jgi:hypothetical protein